MSAIETFSTSAASDPEVNMSLLIPIDTAPTFKPEQWDAPPDRLIEGHPSFKSWPQDTAKDGTIQTGVWEATPGVTHSKKGNTFEFCHILSGVIEITETGGKTWTFRAGDNFVMKPGFTGVWRTIETVRKVYVVIP